MPTETKVNDLRINVLTEAQYEQIQQPSTTELYLVPEVVDTTPTSGSTNTVTSGGVYDALHEITTQALTDLYESVTYSQLVSKVSDSQLVKGGKYRITDYETTTVQENTSSAGHNFDLVVTATDSDKLDCMASALPHAGDTYFTTAGADLSKWQVWYDVQNNTDKYVWADSTNGKGVIYRMVDEYGNDCPYDFKNIMFSRKLDAEGSYDPTGGTDTEVYTFSWFNEDGDIEDLSLIGYKLLNDEESYIGVYGNSMGVASAYTMGMTASNEFAVALNNNVFVSSYYYEVGIFYGCYSNTFGSNCKSNTFGNNCYSNTFGNDCYSNTFGNYCQKNTFGNYCNSNTFGNFCSSNTFSNNCNSSTFGNYCSSNTFGNFCSSNTFGDNCQINTFGNYCFSITFGNSSNQYGDYVKNVTIENGCQYIRLYKSGTANSSNCLQNIYIANGVCGSANSYLEISTIERDLAYRTTVGFDSNGNLRIYNEDDPISSPGTGALNIMADNSSVMSFGANQSADTSLTLKSGLGITLTGDSSDNSITFSTESNHTVISKNEIVHSQHSNYLYYYNVICDLNGNTLKIGDLSDVVRPSYAYDHTNNYIWTKSLSESGKYAGICKVQSTDGCFVFKLTLYNSTDYTTTTHYYGLVADSPKDSTFTFITTCDWDIIVKVNYSQHRLLAYLKIPDSFAGTITLTPLRRYAPDSEIDGFVTSFDYSSGTTIREYNWKNVLQGNGTQSMDTVTELIDNNPETSDTEDYNYIHSPYGNYYVNIIGDFARGLAAGSKVSDSIINDYLLHTLEKRVTNMTQVNADWNASSGVAEILNKPTIPDALPSMTGNAGKVLSVNSGATGAEWVKPVKVYSGSSAPLSNTGSDGDIYIQIVSAS